MSSYVSRYILLWEQVELIYIVDVQEEHVQNISLEFVGLHW